jgi:hypothetical protein
MAIPEGEPLKITAEDLARVDAVPAVVPREETPAAGPRSYGTVGDDPGIRETPEETGSVFLRGWFYLGAAGLFGALAAWAVCEPGFADGTFSRWGNVWMLPGIVTAMCIGFGLAESVVERSARKAAIRGALALPLGLMLGFVFFGIANLIFNVGLNLLGGFGILSPRNPAFWIVRGIGWAIFGVAGGAVYGIVGQSIKKAQYGIFGGMIGAAIGGILFDPVAILTGGAGASRAIGFALVGGATGVAMGLVESILKDRWLYVTAGPLAGKQFILYKDRTTMGNTQAADIYLFKDPNILAEHAVIAVSGSRVQIRASGPVFINGSRATTRMLEDGNLVQIGRYSFRYKEKNRG